MILKSNNNNFYQIKEDLENYIKNLKNYKEILQINKDTFDLLTSLIAGYLSMNIYKYNMFREETYLRYAKNDYSIYEIAYNLGYRFFRGLAPEIQLKYINSKTRFLKTGDILGYYKDENFEYELVYFGENTKIEYNTKINVAIGKLQIIKNYVNFVNDLNILKLKPVFLKSIDNDKIKIYNNENGKKVYISDVFQDFLLNNAVINWSASPFEAEIYLNDKQKKFGYLDLSNIDILYLETNGLIKSIDEKKLKISEDFMFINVGTLGAAFDDVNKIKKYAPIMLNVKNLAIRKNDIEYILKMTNLFDDIYVEPDKGVPAIWKLEIYDNTKGIHLNIEGSIIKVENNFNSRNEFIDAIYNILEKNKIVKPIIIEEGDYENISKELYLEQIYLDREIKITKIEDDFYDTYDISLESNYQERRGCTVNVYYVKKSKEIIRENLTSTELFYLDNYMKKKSIIGMNFEYIPAVPKNLSLSLTIRLIDEEFQEEVYNFILKKIKEKEYKLNLDLDISIFISELLKYKTFRNGVEIYPIRDIKNNYSENKLTTKYYEYGIFENLDIIFK